MRLDRLAPFESPLFPGLAVRLGDIFEEWSGQRPAPPWRRRWRRGGSEAKPRTTLMATFRAISGRG